MAHQGLQLGRPLRVGLIGAGWVTTHHLQGWQQHAARARVVAIADPQEVAARVRADAFSIEQVFTCAKTMLSQCAVDVVDVAVPRELHAEMVLLAAERGLPVLCQKPLAPNYAQACELVAKTQNQTRLMVHENWRFRPYYRQISSWLTQGRIGNVVQAQMSLWTSGLIPTADGKYPAIERQPFISQLDRALVMEILIHHVDTLRFLLGDLRLVHARLGRGCASMAGEDRASLIFENASGAVITLMSNLRVWGESAAKPDELLLVGERGNVTLSGNNLRCEGEQPEHQVHDLDSAYTASYAGVIGHFLDALISGDAFETSPEDNLQTLRLVEEIYTTGN